MNPYIDAIEYYLPEQRLDNEELRRTFGDNPKTDKLLTKLGVEQRHIAASEELVSDLAVKAALRLFEKNGITSQEIDFLILCTQSPDYLAPTTACIVQDRLGLPKSCGALDYNLGCSGFIYGLALAKSLIHAGDAKNVLLILADTYSKHVHPLDKSTRPIFGDGAAAVLVRGSEQGEGGIGRFTFGTDGSGIGNLVIPAGGMRQPRSSETGEASIDKFGNYRSQNNLYMNGPELFKYFSSMMPELVDSVLKKNALAKEDIDLCVFHQASRQMLESLRDCLGLKQERFNINMKDTGNTVSATIPIALRQAEAEGRLKKGDNILAVGFGIGYSWGGTVIKW